MPSPPVTLSPAPDPDPGRAWSSPGLLRRVQAHRGAVTPRRRQRRTLWSRVHGRRWSAEGTMMVVVSVVCVLLTAVAVSAIHGGPGVVSSGSAAPCTLSMGQGADTTCLERAH